MPRDRTTAVTLAVAAGLTAAIFAVDLWTPVGVADWLLYIVPVLIVSRVARRGYLLLFAVVCTVLIGLGTVDSPADVDAALALTNRSIGVLALWITTGLIAQRQVAEDRLRKAYDEMEEKVLERTAELDGSNQALRRTEERFRTMAEASFEGIAIVEDGRLAEANAQFAAMYGYRPDEVIGKPVSAFLVPDDYPRAERAMAEEEDSIHDYRAVRKDGSVFPVEAHGRTIERGGRRVRMTAVRDLTEQKRADEALRQQALVTAGLEERQRLARELHDSAAQALYGIALGIQTARAAVDASRADILEPLAYALSLTETGLADLRALIFDLRPESLQNEGLVVALAKRATLLENRLHAEVRTDLCDEPDVPDEMKETLYAIAREALHNVVKYAQPAHVTVRLVPDGVGLALEVVDDGVGFDPDQPYPGHLGLQSMRERAAYLGAELEVESAPGQGTSVRVRVPGPIAW